VKTPARTDSEFSIQEIFSAEKFRINGGVSVNLPSPKITNIVLTTHRDLVKLILNTVYKIPQSLCA